MKATLAAALASLYLLAGCSTGPGPRHDLSDELDELWVLNCANQFSLEEWRRDQYRLLAKLFLVKGTRADFDRMLADDNPILRHTALFCLAHSDRRAAVAALKARLADHQLTGYRHCASFDSRTSVARTAWKLLHDRDFLLPGDGRRLSPLLPAGELLAVDLAVLADDGGWLVHPEGGRSAEKALLSPQGRFPTLAQVLARCPGLTPLQVIKAVGRLAPSEAQGEFLLGALAERPRPPAELLAIGSALTRQASLEALRAVQTHKADLNGAAPGQWGDRFEQTINRQLDRADLLHCIDCVLHYLTAPAGDADNSLFADSDTIFATTQDEQAPSAAARQPAGPAAYGQVMVEGARILLTEAQFRLLAGDGEPADLQAVSLLLTNHRFFDWGDRKRIIGEALVKMSARLDEGRPWSTWAETADRLHSLADEFSPRTSESEDLPGDAYGTVWFLTRAERKVIMQRTGQWLNLPAEEAPASQPADAAEN